MKTVSPNIEVGIMTVPGLTFRLSGKFAVIGEKQNYFDIITAKVDNDAIAICHNKGENSHGKEIVFLPCNISADFFEIRDVMIGIDFHWQQKENQKFRGALKLKLLDEQIIVTNVLPVEDYLKSVISSEMRADASLELLKAHAIIARSWLLSKIEKRQSSGHQKGSSIASEAEDELIRWWDTEDHQHFDVCADDHCQRYQGIMRMTNPNVIEAVNQTMGQVLKFGDLICDARYSKSCGGMTELFTSCWGEEDHPYLQSFPDRYDKSGDFPDLKNEDQAERFILDTPECFCNTSDDNVLSQVLNDYDRETRDFFRWEISYTMEEISEIIRKRSGHDFGSILSLVPVKRGPSGRLILLKIVGSKNSMTVGKELLIRKWLSPSHLYSSAFIVKEGAKDENGAPESFRLIGAGWGHGVGLCQIGAAVMGEKGYNYYEILQHYYPDAEIKKEYV